jgi:hypothetical protein
MTLAEQFASVSDARRADLIAGLPGGQMANEQHVPRNRAWWVAAHSVTQAVYASIGGNEKALVG